MKTSICIDGIIFSLQRHGGISVYFKELLSYLSSRKCGYIMLFQNSLLQPIIEMDLSGGLMEVQVSRFLERYRKCHLPHNSSVFHSSYYRTPIRNDIPSVVTVHDFIYEKFINGPRSWVHTAQKNSAIRSAQAIICNSESTKDDLLKYVGVRSDQSVYVTHLAASDNFYHLNLKSDYLPFVLFVGQRAGYKNFSLVLKAMEFLPELELHCVGGGAIQSLELQNISDAVVNRVKHLGLVTDEKLNELYNSAVCLVYPSSYEGFGIPVVEAMKAGCPVVCTNCKAVIEIGGNALTVVKDDDPRLMAEAILETMSSSRDLLIQKGEIISQRYSWENTHRQTLAVYKSLGA